MSSSSLFACQPLINEHKNKTCVFKGVSACGDHVSHLICNNHAGLFGIIYKVANYKNGDNNVWTKIVTYISTNANLSIPLFQDSYAKILASDIRSFALNVCNINQNINVDEFQNRIACLMGVNIFTNLEDSKKCWLDDPLTEIILRKVDEEPKAFRGIPLLHKILFHYTSPSVIRNPKSGSQTYLVTNLSLTYNHANDRYSFEVPNGSCVLKWTENENCVATPIVLDAIRVISEQNEDRTFKPIFNQYMSY